MFSNENIPTYGRMTRLPDKDKYNFDILSEEKAISGKRSMSYCTEKLTEPTGMRFLSNIDFSILDRTSPRSSLFILAKK
jgi:hypothetical protein